MEYVGNLYTEVVANGRGTERRTSFVLWNLDASFRAADWLTLWVRGENLLAQRYEINAGYPMPRATCTGGVKVNF